MNFSVIEGARRLAQKTGNRKQDTGKPETEHWTLETGYRKPETGNGHRTRKPDTGNRKQDTGSRTPETGNWTQAM